MTPKRPVQILCRMFAIRGNERPETAKSGIQFLQAQSIRACSLVQRVVALLFQGVDRDDGFAVLHIWNSGLGVERADSVKTSPAQARFQAAWPIGSAGMHDAAFIAPLVSNDLGFDHQQAGWTPCEQSQRRRETDDAAADYGKVVLHRVRRFSVDTVGCRTSFEGVDHFPRRIIDRRARREEKAATGRGDFE